MVRRGCGNVPGSPSGIPTPTDNSNNLVTNKIFTKGSEQMNIEFLKLVWCAEDVARFLASLGVFLLLLATVIIWLPVKWMMTKREVNK